MSRCLTLAFLIIIGNLTAYDIAADRWHVTGTNWSLNGGYTAVLRTGSTELFQFDGGNYNISIDDDRWTTNDLIAYLFPDATDWTVGVFTADSHFVLQEEATDDDNIDVRWETSIFNRDFNEIFSNIVILQNPGATPVRIAPFTFLNPQMIDSLYLRLPGDTGWSMGGAGMPLLTYPILPTDSILMRSFTVSGTEDIKLFVRPACLRYVCFRDLRDILAIYSGADTISESSFYDMALAFEWDTFTIAPGEVETLGLEFSVLDSASGIAGIHTPQDFRLHVYPNPFNSAVNIRVRGFEDSRVRVEIFDINGRMVAEMPVGAGSKPARAGWSRTLPYEIIWRPSESIGSGVYLVRAKIGDGQTTTKRIVYLK